MTQVHDNASLLGMIGNVEYSSSMECLKRKKEQKWHVKSRLGPSRSGLANDSERTKKMNE